MKMAMFKLPPSILHVFSHQQNSPSREKIHHEATAVNRESIAEKQSFRIGHIYAFLREASGTHENATGKTMRGTTKSRPIVRWDGLLKLPVVFLVGINRQDNILSI
jgi:hypothetical protein